MFLKLKLLILILFGWSTTYASHDKYRLLLRDDPATTITIGWNQVSGNDAMIYYDTTDHGTDYQSYRFTKSADRSITFKGMNNRFVRLTNLLPDTAYYFVIVDNQQTSRRLWFKTCTSDRSRLSFIAGGDSRNNREPRKNANLMVSKLKPNAILFGGDMTDDDTDDQWQKWFDDWQLTIADDGRMFPLVAARGNHEESNESIYHLFDTPNIGIYYALTFGDNVVRTYTLNTEISIYGDQTDWLTQDLENSQNTIWRIAQYHKPIRPHLSYKPEGNAQYNNWAQLFYDQKVQLVVECDSHLVKSTWPIKPSSNSGNDQGFVRDNQKGTVYIGEGCWGAPLKNNDDTKSWTRNSDSFNQFKWIFIDENKMEARTIKIDNATQVIPVSNDDRFAIPANLDIWKPSNGSVVTILNSNNTRNDPDLISTVVVVSYGEDDVEEDKNGKILKESDELELIYNDQNNAGVQKIGLRFRSVSIPQNALISEAYLQFTADDSESEATTLVIGMEDTADALPFTDQENVSSRNQINEVVTWFPKEWIANQAGLAQQSPDIKNLIQKIVAKKAWKEGNSMVVTIDGKGNSLRSPTSRRTAESFEAGVTKAAKLIVSYKINTLNISSSEIMATNLVVSPNPFDEDIEISGLFQRFKAQERYHLAIYSINGKEVYSDSFFIKNDNTISRLKIKPNITNTGMYFINIKDNQGTIVFTEKVFKQ
ncbi:metallophosphoesterase [Aquimarina sp. ERC-38]|uniref:fibronectin type III domain-containing protein n=1 Tax=Aquimarina sp. ERC-38 TaxID=2949996 RepID=UPI002245F6DC|nr:fibronectin type III domain-containing protein [Aquimarina sp. ERC-38]UZO80323.1 metallophosphoesterase [Aquimarina sp. ERC-38]